MMKTLLKYLLAVTCMCSALSCEKKKEECLHEALSPRTATIFFVVTDADTGEDLLDPEVENCLLEDVRITYDGNVYRYDMERGVGIYTATLERFIMRWGHYTKMRPDDPYCLSIGQFDCPLEGLEASLSVDWGDGGETTECSSDLPRITTKPLIWRLMGYRRSERLSMEIIIPY